MCGLRSSSLQQLGDDSYSSLFIHKLSICRRCSTMIYCIFSLRNKSVHLGFSLQQYQPHPTQIKNSSSVNSKIHAAAMPTEQTASKNSQKHPRPPDKGNITFRFLLLTRFVNLHRATKPLLPPIGYPSPTLQPHRHRNIHMYRFDLQKILRHSPKLPQQACLSEITHYFGRQGQCLLLGEPNQ
jgi:hypothetical protein